MEAEKLALVVDDGARVVDVNGYDITVRASDPRYLESLQSLTSKMQEATEATDDLDEAETAMRGELDAFFGVGFCEKVFGEASLFAMSGGLTLVEQLLFGIIDFMDDDVKKNAEAREAAVGKYTHKYRKGVR